MEEKIKVPFWQSVWFVVLMLFLLPPVGIVLVWVSGEFKGSIRIVFTVLAALYLMFVFPTVAGNLFGTRVVHEVSQPANGETFTDEQKQTIKSDSEEIKQSLDELVEVWTN